MTLQTDYEHTTNGSAPSSAGPRIPRREAWIDLPPEYPGFKLLAWVNHPKRLQDEMNSGDNDRVRAALTQIVTAHNGWLDDLDQPFPPASDPALWDVLPDELAAAAVVVVRLESGKLAERLVPPTRRR